jgi:hypothetical protein
MTPIVPNEDAPGAKERANGLAQLQGELEAVVNARPEADPIRSKQSWRVPHTLLGSGGCSRG